MFENYLLTSLPRHDRAGTRLNGAWPVGVLFWTGVAMLVLILNSGAIAAEFHWVLRAVWLAAVMHLTVVVLRKLEMWDAEVVEGYGRPGFDTSITTTVQGGTCGEARRAARRLAWERLARSLHSCVSSSHRSSSAGPNRSRGSISRTTR